MVFGCPCPSLLPAPGGPSAAPAAVGGGFWLWFISWGVCYGWFRFCFGFVPWCRCCGSAFVLRLGMGSPGFAWRRWLVSGSGLSVCAVRLLRARCRFCAWCGCSRLAGLAAFRFGRFPRVRCLRFAGSGFCGQGGASVRAVCQCGSRGFACLAFAFFFGGFGCLVYLAWSLLPVRGHCPRPVPPWWCK